MQSAQFELLQAIFYPVDAGMLSQHNPNLSQETTKSQSTLLPRVSF